MQNAKCHCILVVLECHLKGRDQRSIFYNRTKRKRGQNRQFILFFIFLIIK